MRRQTEGFTLIELLIVIVVIGMMMAIMVPRFRPTQRMQVRRAAQQIVHDLEAVRTRALSTRDSTQVAFNTAGQSYAGYLDFATDGLTRSTAEVDSLRVFRGRGLPAGIVYGRGSVSADVPGMTGAGTTSIELIPTCGSLRCITFDPRGLSAPFGSGGAIYLQSQTDPNAVAAITITPAAGIRSWFYPQGGPWQ